MSSNIDIISAEYKYFLWSYHFCDVILKEMERQKISELETTSFCDIISYTMTPLTGLVVYILAMLSTKK